MTDLAIPQYPGLYVPESMVPDYSAFFHPSFRPLLNKFPERGKYSPWAYIEWETWEGHSHIVMVGDGKENALRVGGSIEDMAEELVEVMQICNPDRHKGHGRKHDSDQFKHAYKSGIEQLLERRYDAERMHAVWLQQMYAKWGGNIPAAVVMPSNEDFDQWQVLVPDHRGDPQFKKVRQEVALELGQLAPPTKELTKAPLGWYRRPRRDEARLRNLMRKGL